MKLIAQLYLFFLFSSSCTVEDRKIYFTNQSGLLIDSIQLGISSKDVYKTTRINIESNDTIICLIPKNTPKSNYHDITVFVTIFINGLSPINDFYYNDLSSQLTHNFCIALNKEKKVKWQTCK